MNRQDETRARLAEESMLEPDVVKATSPVLRGGTVSNDRLLPGDSAIKRTEKKLEYLGSNEETLALYRAREDSLHERANMISSAKMEGMEEGVLKVAKNMLAKNLSPDLITEVTGLSKEEIKALQAESKKKTH